MLALMELSVQVSHLSQKSQMLESMSALFTPSVIFLEGGRRKEWVWREAGSHQDTNFHVHFQRI